MTACFFPKVKDCARMDKSTSSIFSKNGPVGGGWGKTIMAQPKEFHITKKVESGQQVRGSIKTTF